MAKKWIVRPLSEREIVIELPDDVEFNDSVPQIRAETLLRALASYVEDQRNDFRDLCQRQLHFF